MCLHSTPGRAMARIYNYQMPFFKTIGAFGVCCSLAAAVDLRTAVIWVAPGAASPEKKAAGMLSEEIAKRTQIRLEVTNVAAAGRPVIALGLASELGSRANGLPAAAQGPDGYRVKAGANGVVIAGNDARGTLFGAGFLLRRLRMERQVLTVDDTLQVSTAPRYPLRGHQLGYRPKVNAYDGWTPSQFEQYIRDLAVFGTNAVELIPPRSDDDEDSPHFLLPKIEMMVEVSRICKEYGIDVWIWYPAMDKDYSDPATVEFAMKEWAEVYRRLPRIDAIFVPGGDPGHTRPKYMMALLEKQTQSLHRFHPKAQMWMSPQGFDAAWMDEFLAIMRTEPAWLSGIVFGPQIRMSLPKLREAIPKRYPIRHYPDITHSKQSQYPVPDWDIAYAVTESREVINPRPLDQAAIFRRTQPYTAGFLTYSEGCNDDVNKFIWSGLGWDPSANVLDILRQYSRYFIGDEYEDSFAQGLLALERNWRGPLANNAGVYTTLEQFQSMERSSSPETRLNWRFQQALYRAYYDAYMRGRLLYETALEESAMDRLREAKSTGTLAAVDRAQETLDRSAATHPAEDWRARIFELAEALFQSIRMQLSVEKYKAISVDRGATLDTLDVPLNSRRWLDQRFAAIRKMVNEADRRSSIDEILNWTNPGPGGFYDDLGDPATQPHLVRTADYAADPAFLNSAHVGFGGIGSYRKSFWTSSASLNDEPLRMHYADLDPKAEYKIRVVYGGDSPRQKLRLVANGSIEIHPFIVKQVPYQPVEFEIPRDATRNGELNLAWTREPGQGGNGRGCQVSEIWLIKK